MPLTVIEQVMFSSTSTHAVTAFGVSATRITVRIAPWTGEEVQAQGQETDPERQRQGDFLTVRLISREVPDDGLPQDQEPLLPWDIIGFDAYDLGQERWQFVLCCCEIAYVWESNWPQIEPVVKSG